MIFYIFIILYHIIIHNNLEKMTNNIIFNYDLIKRPNESCNTKLIESLKCMGMPSGHAELITILAFLLFQNKNITLEIAILLIIIISSQRVISKRHTIKQVIAGIILGLIYSKIYISSKYSFIFILLIGFILVNFIIYNIDLELNQTQIPKWVSSEMYPLITKKQNISYFYKILHIYYNTIANYPLTINWSKLENIMDIVVDQILLYENKNKYLLRF